MAQLHVSATFSDRGKMSARFARRRMAITPALLAADMDNAARFKARAQSLSRGDLKTKEQQKLARLFNKGRGLYSTASPLALTPYVINEQTGFFLRHWQVRITNNENGNRITLFNTAAYAKFLFTGTRVMIARPILQKVAELEVPAAHRRLDRAFKRAATVK